MVVRVLKGPFTVDDYYRLVECGVLDEDDRVELLDGRVVEMSPIGSRHGGCVKYLLGAITRLVGGRAIVSVQDPVRLDARSEPQPDIAVLRPRADSYRNSHPGPGDVLLLIEVADSSLESEGDVKLPLYARAGIPEVWLVDLGQERIDVHRHPAPSGYADLVRVTRGQSVTVP